MASPAQKASQLSMKYVMAKKKDKWLELFADDACIEDPVGKSPLDETGTGHKGRKAVEAFWQNNIEPNEFFFNIRESIVPEGSQEVCNIGQVRCNLNCF